MDGNAGVILAGGKSSRMGENKAELLCAGEPLLTRVVRRLAPVVDRVLVIGPPSLEPLSLGAGVVGDLVPAVGPLSGLYTALKTTSYARIVVVACDMPFVQPGLVRAMLRLAEQNANAEAIVLETATRLQPLHAVYARRCLPAVERALDTDDHSMHAMLARLSVVRVSPETVSREDPRGLSTFNVNTPADWQHALRLAEEAECGGAPSDGR